VRYRAALNSASKMEIDKNASDETLIAIARTPAARLHFSQLGEDCLLWHYFHTVIGGFYVDVGCHHPTRYSNTYLLHNFRKWRGINIDADERAIAKFRESRPEDINLAIGVGSSVGELEFSVFDDGAVNTFDPRMALQQQNNFGIPKVAKIPILPLAEILDRYAPSDVSIDYMDVDCEGLDHEVIASNNWSKYRPKIVTVELFGFPIENPLSHQTVAFMKAQDYRIISYCHATLFFERITSV
jgi:FkbM family methyltransferase